MASRSQYRTEDVARTPRGYKVRSLTRGSHVLRIAFPEGTRRRGVGKVVQILHPKKERNPQCEVSEKAKSNPSELLIFGNPSKPRGHKPGSACFACKKNPAKGTKHDLYGRKFRGATRAEAVQRALKHRELKGRRAAKDIVEKHESAAMRLDYTALGKLIALGLGEPKKSGNALVNAWEKEDHIGFEGDGVTLASSPDGKQLYLIGGNQNLASCLHRFQVDRDKDFIDLGEIGFVVYEARKIHGDYQPVEYVHQFGEKSGALPQAMYDKLRKRIFLVGGEYFIDLSKPVSPGI